MQTESTVQRSDWFTHDLEPDGQQICAIRPDAATDVTQRLILSHDDSRLLQLLLNEIAQDNSIPFAEARQAVLRAMYRAHCPVESRCGAVAVG